MINAEALFPEPVNGALTPPSHHEETDVSLDQVEAWFRAQPRLVERFGDVLRKSIDEVLDGQRTGRFDIYGRDVAKTERTYLGTKVEIVCQDEFGLDRGRKMDYLLAGHEVDAKFSMSSIFGQAIPKEAVGHICLLMHADDRRSLFSVGLVRVSTALLNSGANQDGKRTLSRHGRTKVRMLIDRGPLPENQLLSLPRSTIDAIFARGLSGQARVNQLFRLVQGRILDRRTVVTAARQLDAPKRARDARPTLCIEGILILGHGDGHLAIARALALPLPNKGEWVSIRVVPRPPGDPRHAVAIGDTQYVIAREGEIGQPVPLG